VGSYYVRWRDHWDVVHWVTNQRNNRTYTDCGVVVAERTQFTGPDGARATSEPPTCLECIVGAEPDLEGHRGG